MQIVTDKNKVALYFKDNAISYKEFILNTKKIKQYTNIKEFTNNMIYMENRPELLYSFFSIWDSRATCVCIDASSTAEELSYYIDNSEVEKIFTSRGQLEKVEEAFTILNKKVELVIVDDIEFDKIKIDENLEANLVINSPEKEDTALILYTSGTTGKPKGVMLTFDNILANVDSLDVYKMYEETDVTIALLPLHHILPLLGTGVMPLLYSATIVFLDDMSSVALIDAMKKYKVTMLIGVPKLWEVMHKKIMDTINSKGITRFIFKLAKKINSLSFSKKIFKKVSEGFGGHIKFFVSGGSKLNPQITEDFLTLGIKICEGYGMTETSPIIAYTPKDDIMPNSAGRVIKDVEVKIADDNEILVKGRNVMKGYYKNPEATAEIIDKDGWLHTGDLGTLKDGYLYVTGRKKEMIVLSNGKNINPIDIEAKLMSMTNLIAEVVVTEYNSILTAVIHPDFNKVKEEKVDNIYEVLKWSVVDKYNQKSPDYKKILDVKIVNEDFPKTKIGKIKRFMIADMLEGKIEKKERKPEPDFEEYNKIKKYLVTAKEKEVYFDSHIEIDLGMDSLDMVEFQHFLDLNFGVKEENLISKYPSLLELANYVKENRNQEKIGNLNWKEIINKDTDAKLPSSSFLAIIFKFLSCILFNTFFRVKVKGKEKIEMDKPTIYVANHQSFLDGFLFNYAVPSKLVKKTYFLATVAHFKSSMMKSFANSSNVVLVDINKDIAEVMQILAKILKENKNVAIYPEGLRTRDGKMNKFKKSFAILAKELNVDVQPYVISGAYELFPTGKKFPKPGKISVEFLDKIKVEDLSYDEIVDRSYKSIEEKLTK
ncbi:AMP-binding protein [Fusobacterium pseudoperiodonticum]|uniref:AMP-binding protein n=1 Tax=Fusobacterium pseudoperiodonticum TaxID=2663009 RepID=UPI0028E4D34A|nr:AMP-binding protein [Fusobacterium pseudoperiodonticum]